MRNTLSGATCLLLTVILLTGVLIVLVMAQGTVNKTEIIFNITTPREDDVFYNDVVPAYLSVKGTISGSNNIRNVTVTYGDETAECGKKNGANFYVSCSFLINDNVKNITIDVVDDQGFVTSEKRNFSSYAGPPPPGWIFIYGTVVDADGIPVRNAVLTFETEIKDYGPYSVNTTTDRDGKYIMKKTSGYQQRITVRKAGYQTRVLEVTFEDYYDELNFTLPPQKSSASGFDFLTAVYALAIISLVSYFRRDGNFE